METERSSVPEISQAAATATATAAAAPARASCWSALRLWALLAGFAYIAWIGSVRLVTTIASWYWLDFANITPGPLYLAVTGGLWGIIALVALFWIILRRPWFRLAGFSAALFFAFTYWIDRLFVSADPRGAGNTPFAILLTLALLAFTFFVLRPLVEVQSIKAND